MKVELDLSTEQLENLDKGLTELLGNLTDEQKVSVIQTYLNEKFDKFYNEHNSISYYSSSCSKELSEFGRKLISGLQDKISNSISKEMLDNKDLKENLDMIVTDITSHMYDIVKNSLSTYIINNLFTNKETILTIMQSYINQHRDSNGRFCG